MSFSEISNNITIPDLFLKRLAINAKTEKEIRDELKKFSKKHTFDEKEVIYNFIKRLLKTDLYFRIKREIIDPILFETIYWSSIIETKKKIRPKNINAVPTEKVNDVYTDLQKEMVLAIHREYENRMILEIELKRYLILFFELSCIKRDRRKRNKNDL